MPAERFLLKEILSVSIPDLQIMDIGAMIEGEDRYQTLVSQGVATVTGFEPNSENLKLLNARQGAYKYLPNFLGDGKPATFHRTRYPGCSSLLEPNGDLINLFTSIGAESAGGNFAVVETTEVKTSRLDDIEGLALPDYVKLDVQGAELLVLENAQKSFADTVVLETEVEFVAIYKDQPLFCDIQKFLVGQGFMLHKLLDIAGRALRPMRFKNPYRAMSQVLWADAIFIRDYTNLSVYSDQQLLKASIILNDVYLSYDVVARLLGEYDKRRSTNFGAKYSAALSSRKDLEFMYMNLKEQN